MTSGRNRRRSNSRANPDLTPTTPLSEVYLTIGRITAPHGLRGEVKMMILTDRPNEILDLDHVYFDESSDPIALNSCRITGNGRQTILSFNKISNRNQSEMLRGTVVKVRGDQLTLPDDESYFHYQIIGLDAILESGEPLGNVTDIIEAGEVDVYVITGEDGKQQLFPALQEVVVKIDIDANQMTIRPQQWAGGDQ